MDLPKKSIIAPVDLYCASSCVAPAPGDALDAPEDVVVDPLGLDTVVFAPMTGEAWTQAGEMTLPQGAVSGKFTSEAKTIMDGQ